MASLTQTSIGQLALDLLGGRLHLARVGHVGRHGHRPRTHVGSPPGELAHCGPAIPGEAEHGVHPESVNRSIERSVAIFFTTSLLRGARARTTYMSLYDDSSP
jgi:hypothetical protein